MPALVGFGQSYKEERKAMKEHQARADTTAFPSPFEFTFIDSVGLTKEQLFSKVNLWIPTAFKNMNLDLAKDSSAGKIVLPNIGSSYLNHYQYDMTIDVRNNKYRFVFNDYKMKNSYGTMIPIQVAENEKGFYIGTSKKAFWNNEKLYLKEMAEALYNDFKKYLNAKDDF